jgi:hypothetical protein
MKKALMIRLEVCGWWAALASSQFCLVFAGSSGSRFVRFLLSFSKSYFRSAISHSPHGAVHSCEYSLDWAWTMGELLEGRDPLPGRFSDISSEADQKVCRDY